MLNSQQRNVKKNNAQPTGSFYYFFCQSREEPTLPTAVCEHEFIFMPSHSVRSKAKPAAAWFIKTYFYVYIFL